MDVSPEYVKMCENAEEIQNKGIPINDSKSYIVERDISSTNYHMVWLPRQDQLQEMIEPIFDTLGGKRYHLIFHFVEWLNKKKYNGKSNQCSYVQIANLPNMDDWPSMEQLWLAFVMKEKFQKIWNGEDWIKEEKCQTAENASTAESLTETED